MFTFFTITLILLLIYGLLIRYYKQAWTELPYFRKAELPANHLKVSVVIPARNEQSNIASCLEALIAQVYPKSFIEVLVINDHSTDKTENIVRGFSDENIKLFNLADYEEDRKSHAYKKKALELGIRQSTGELIITTDADCVAGPLWIEQLVACYRQNQSVFIAAPVKIIPGNSLLSRFQSLDFLTLQGITGASVYKNFHNMCNGANLAYQRQAFFAVDGFKGIDDIASGDDMLLMQKINSRFPGRISYLKSKQAIVSTQAAETWKAFFNQRIRWASKAGRYKDSKITLVLLVVYVLNLFILTFLFAGFIYPVSFLYFLILVVLKTLIEYSFVQKIAAFFDLLSLMIYFPLFQPLHIVYTVIAGWLGMFSTYQWKERTVR